MIIAFNCWMIDFLVFALVHVALKNVLVQGFQSDDSMRNVPVYIYFPHFVKMPIL